MSVRLDMAWLGVVFLISLRLGALFALAPGFGTIRMPGPFRVFLVITLAVGLTAALGTAPVQPITGSVWGFLLSGLNELVVGALLGFGLFTAFGVFMFAGRAMDMQIGFGIASLIDPTSRTQSPLLGTMLNLLGLAIFFAIDGHHMLLRGLAISLERVPPGAGLGGIDASALVAQFGVMFSLGLALAAPVLMFLLLIDIGFAVMSRTMPQLNVFFLSMPVKIFAGLSVLALSLPHAGSLVNRVFRSIFSFWDQVLP